MSLAQFDVAAALYREEPVVLYYLDHDPAQAARYSLDVHLSSGAASAVIALSNVWHAVNPEHLPLDLESPYGGLFARRSPPAKAGQATLQAEHPDRFYEERSGDRTYWLLMGQRIGGLTWQDHPNSLWAAAGAANYRWAHAYGVACAHEHKYRFGYYPSTLPQLWTLEALPPQLLKDEEAQTAPTPIVPGDSIVLDDDGYYDTVESYRQYYRLHKQALFHWYRRGPPTWLQEDPPPGP